LKKYKYVVASGCSFTVGDILAPNIVNPGETYGDIVANHFDAKFYNLAEGGAAISSMYRRTLEWCGNNKDKFKDTLIILGMTGVNRIEVWNNWDSKWQTDLTHHPLLDAELEIKLMIDWPLEQRKNYFINFYNDNAQFLLATNMIIGLQSFLTLNNIDHVFFDALDPIDTYWEKFCDDKEDKFGHKLLFDNLVSHENWYKHPEYKSFNDCTYTNIQMGAYKDGTDPHPNKEGHEYWSKCLIEFIDEKINN